MRWAFKHHSISSLLTLTSTPDNSTFLWLLPNFVWSTIILKLRMSTTFKRQAQHWGKCCPCYANLTIGLWEARCVWDHNPFAAHLVSYGRYIDDIIIIWDSSTQSVQDFVTHCSSNTFRASFNSVIDTTSLCFYWILSSATLILP